MHPTIARALVAQRHAELRREADEARLVSAMGRAASRLPLDPSLGRPPSMVPAAQGAGGRPPVVCEDAAW